MSKVVALVLALSCVEPAHSQMFTLRHTFDDPIPGLGEDQFGDGVVVNGNRILIADSGHSGANNPCCQSIGQVHLLDGATGDLIRTFDDPFRSDQYGDRFGWSVAMDGNHVLIGELGGLHHVSLFDADTGVRLRTFSDPSPGGDNGFGYSVAINGDRVLIGANGDDTTGVDRGRAHLFDLAGNLLQTFDDPTPTSRDGFGRSVALRQSHVLIGASGDDTQGNGVGQAHLFDLAGNLLQTFDDPTVTDRDSFGSSVALDGDHVLIGARFDDTNVGLITPDNVGQAHLFDLAGNLLQTFDDPTPTQADHFGGRVSLDGDRVLIGAGGDDMQGLNIGQFYLFDLTGNLLQIFDDPNVSGVDTFSEVAMDGNRIVVGDSANAQAYFFSAAATPDFNGDGVIDCVDVDSLVAEIVAGTNNFTFDVTGDGIVDTADLDEWLVQAGVANLPSGNPYLVGDATLNGIVDGLDYIAWNNNKFMSVPAWCSGDFNADGTVDGEDFVLWNGNKFTSSDGVSAVPEPTTGVLLIVVMIGLVAARRPAGAYWEATKLARCFCTLSLACCITAGTALGQEFEFLFSFGSYGTGDGEFQGPGGIAVDAVTANIYVLDGGNDRIQVFDNAGNYQFQFGSAGAADGQFRIPTDVALNHNGQVYVADGLRNDVQVFDSAGNYQFKFGGSRFQRIDIASNGDVYVVDRDSYRVQVFDSGGDFQFSLGSNGTGNGQFVRPQGIGIDDSGRVFVSDRDFDNVQVFDGFGNYDFEFGGHGSGDGQFRHPDDVAFDAFGNAYVTDSHHPNPVQVFDHGGAFQFAFGTRGIFNGQFQGAGGIAIESGRIYVADGLNHRISVWRTGSGADVDEDGVINCADADALVSEIVAGTNDYLFDLTNDDRVDVADLDEWLVQGGAANLPSGNPYLRGDANLDGTVDGLDFIEWNNHKFTSTAAWCSGDFNADGLVDGLDFVLWNDNKYTSSDGVNAVPEPGAGVLLFAAVMCICVVRRTVDEAHLLPSFPIK